MSKIPQHTKQVFLQLQELYADKQTVQQHRAELKDLLTIYLDTDLAGDNQDRRNKLAAVNKIQDLLSLIFKTK